MGTQLPKREAEAGDRAPNFRPISIIDKRLDASRCHLVWRYSLSPGDFVLDGDPDPLNFRPMFIIHRESKKGATLTMAITLSILDRFANFFHCCKEQ